MAFPKWCYCEGKRTEHVVAIMQRLAAGAGAGAGHPRRARGLRGGAGGPPRPALPRAGPRHRLRADSRCPAHGTILVVSAGTADLPVAEEAAVTAEVMGNAVERLYDVGVAGLHRLLAHLDRISRPRC